MTTRRSIALGSVLLTTMIAAGCASTTDGANIRSTGVLAAPAAKVTPTTTSPAAPECNREASLAPDATIAPTSYMEKIRANGILKVGVDQNTQLFGFRDRATGSPAGLDVDLLRAVARAIFNVPDGQPIDDKIDFRAVTTSQRLPAVEHGDVDIVASLITATCARQRDAGLSTVYYLAHQDVLSRDGDRFSTLQDFAGKKVCATTGSTSLEQFKQLVPTAKMRAVAARTDCLVALEDGTV